MLGMNFLLLLLLLIIHNLYVLPLLQQISDELISTSTDSNDKVLSSDWESVTMEKTQWTILVKQLEDLLVLQCLLKMKPVDEGLIGKTAWEIDHIPVTVKKVIDGGRGIMIKRVL